MYKFGCIGRARLLVYLLGFGKNKIYVLRWPVACRPVYNLFVTVIVIFIDAGKIIAHDLLSSEEISKILQRLNDDYYMKEDRLYQ